MSSHSGARCGRGPVALAGGRRWSGRLTLRAGWACDRVAGPSSLEEGSPYHLVTPRVQRDGRIFRPAVLVASALALACVVAAVASSGASRSVLQAVPGQSSEVPLEMMPDPAEAVTVAQETINQVNPFHRGGSWIGEQPALALAPPRRLRRRGLGSRHAPVLGMAVPPHRRHHRTGR